MEAKMTRNDTEAQSCQVWFASNPSTRTASGPMIASDTASWITAAALRSAVGENLRWYRVATVTPESATRPHSRLAAPTSRMSTLCQTTSATPSRPTNTPAHWRAEILSVLNISAAVASGWQAMIRADTPADMPRYWALWLAPSWTACSSILATARWANSLLLLGQAVRHSSTTGSRQSRPKMKRKLRNVNGGAYCSPALVAT